MNKQTWYVGQLVTQGEMNDAFDRVEAADHALVVDHDTWGALTGLVVGPESPASLSVEITDGTAYDETGQRIPVTGGPATIDLTSEVPGTPGEEVYVSIEVWSSITDSDPRIDKNGNPLDYLQTESFTFGYTAGTPAAIGAATYPSLVTNRVRLAIVKLTNGVSTITSSEIASYWYNVERQDGGVVLPAGRVSNHQAVWNPAFGGDVIRAMGNNINLIAGNVTQATRVEAEDPNPASAQGFLYKNPADGSTRDVDKWWSCEASNMLPGEQAAHAWDAAPSVNSWYLEHGAALAPLTVGGRLGWRQEFTASDGDDKGPLYVPLVGLPMGCQLVSASAAYQVDGGGMGANHYLKLWIMKILHSTGVPSIINSGGSAANERNASIGYYEWATPEAVTASEMYHPENYAYFLAITHYASGGAVTAEDVVRILTAKVNYQIREASGLFVVP